MQIEVVNNTNRVQMCTAFIYIYIYKYIYKQTKSQLANKSQII